MDKFFSRKRELHPQRQLWDSPPIEDLLTILPFPMENEIQFFAVPGPVGRIAYGKNHSLDSKAGTIPLDFPPAGILWV